MKEPVYFIPSVDSEDDNKFSERLLKAITTRNLFDFISEKDMVAVKTHFGEGPSSGFVRPAYLKAIGDLLKEKKALPFLTETQTLYRGNRTDAVTHLRHAHTQGFGMDATGLPIIMADGLYGDEEIEVEIQGRLYDRVTIASLIVKANALVVVSHFTGHLAAGFGAALKNIGMGCSSRKGKMTQHSTAKPKIKKKVCTACGMCVEWCPESAITMKDKYAVIDSSICIGCGHCLAVCRFDAVAYNWKVTYEDLQKKVVEHAMGVVAVKKGKSIYINFLTRISKDCDCMTGYEQIVPDIGILISYDPVAVDAASLYLVEQEGGKTISELAYDIPSHCQIDYAEEIGFGNPDFELIEI